MLCILKFFTNNNKGSSDNDVISRTLLKIAVVSRHYKQKPDAVLPKHGELWVVKIIKETSTGNEGAFICEPIRKVEESSLMHLVPGLFCKQLVKGKLMVYPKKPGYDWILPLVHKKHMADQHNAHCIIVPLDASDQDLKDCEAAEKA